MSAIESIVLRVPDLRDGIAVFRLVERCPPLDGNSVYCNLLPCSHFASTSVAAGAGDELVGFISGYRIPERPHTLFVWQVAVDQSARGLGLGLATRMLMHILRRLPRDEVTYLETTITSGNNPSFALFEGLARRLSTSFQSVMWLDEKNHFDGRHESEMLIRIGPFTVRKEK